MAKPVTGETRRLTGPTCDECHERDAARRHMHFLRFADEGALAGHLLEEFGEDAQKDGTISAILSWVRSIRERYADKVDDNGLQLPVWRAWAIAQHRSKREVNQAPKTEAGRLLAAKVWDSLATAYGKEISISLRDEFLADLNTGEIMSQEEKGPLAEDVSDVMTRWKL